MKGLFFVTNSEQFCFGDKSVKVIASLWAEDVLDDLGLL